MENEKRLIDAYALAEQVHDSKNHNPHTDIKVARNHRFEHEHFIKMVCLAPTVDAVEVVHAHWDNNGICTMCGYPIPTDSKCDFIDEDDCLFCYHCGAKMKGENEDG